FGIANSISFYVANRGAASCKEHFIDAAHDAAPGNRSRLERAGLEPCLLSANPSCSLLLALLALKPIIFGSLALKPLGCSLLDGSVLFPCLVGCSFACPEVLLPLCPGFGLFLQGLLIFSLRFLEMFADCLIKALSISVAHLPRA